LPGQEECAGLKVITLLEEMAAYPNPLVFTEVPTAA